MEGKDWLNDIPPTVVGKVSDKELKEGLIAQAKLSKSMGKEPYRFIGGEKFLNMVEDSIK